MTEIYKCQKCGKMVEMIEGGSGTLVCCDEPMVLQVPNSVDAATEKHVPVVEYTGNGVTVKVGSVPHPMEDAHYIEWIEIEYDHRTERKYLKPGEAPEAGFNVQAKDVTARIYCNLHGLWISASQ